MIDKNKQLKQINRKIIKCLIYLLVAGAFLGFTIFISKWEKTAGGSFGWYYFIAILFFSIRLIMLLLAIAERNILINPEAYKSMKMRR